MKKQILSVLFIIKALALFAQLGVGTISPTTTLHIAASPEGLTKATGITIPVVNEDMTATIVIGTEVSQLVYSSHTNSTGYHFWNGSSWRALLSSGTHLESTIDIDVSSDITISQNASIYNLINGVPSENPTLTLPSPSGVNADKLIAIINSNTATTINLAGNIVGNITQLGSGKSGILYSNGTHWTSVIED